MQNSDVPTAAPPGAAASDAELLARGPGLSPSRLFIERPVATSLFMLAIFFAGLLGYRMLPLAALPQIDSPTIQVMTLLPGASPDLMAATVTAPLERNFGQMPGLERLTSSSSAGASVITLRFSLSMPLDVAEQQVQAAINATSTLLPAGLPTPPVYSKVNPADAPVLTIAVMSETLPVPQVHDHVETRLAQKISQVQGVGLVRVAGGRRPAVRVQADVAALARLGLSLEDVRGVIDASNVNLAKGGFDGPTRASTIDANDQLKSASEFSSLIIAYRDGTPLRLGDVARVIDDAENTRLAAWGDRRPAVILNVQRQPGANVIETVDRVKALLPELQAALPASVKVQVLADRTVTIRASVHDVQLELLCAIALVVGVIFIFLRSAKATLIPAVAVPLSLVGTFGVMHLAGYSINNLTLMALTISTGFVVDDAIVMIENIARRIEAGEGPMSAAFNGARQIGFTIISLTISLLAVLIPLLFMGDVIGRLFHEFAVTLAISILISAVVSLTLTPMMCGRMLRHQNVSEQGRFHQTTDRCIERMVAAYDRSLRWMLERRDLSMGLFCGTLLVTVFLYMVIAKGLFPVQDTGGIQVVTEASGTTSFEAMSELQQEVAARLLKDPAVQHVSSFIGVDGDNPALNVGRMLVSLKPLAERRVGVLAVIERLKAATGDLPGMQTHFQPIQDLTLDERVSKTAYQVTLSSSLPEQLSRATAGLLAGLRARPELTDVISDRQDGGLQAYVRVDRDAASRLGVSMSAVNSALYNALGQRIVSTIFTQSTQYRVVLEAGMMQRQGPQSLLNLHVPGANGAQVPLGAIATLEERPAALLIQHDGQLPANTVFFNLSPGTALSEGVAAVNAVLAAQALPASVVPQFQGATRVFQTSGTRTLLLMLAAVFTMYIVLGVLYESFIHPVTILSTLPSAGAGALAALMALRMDLDIIAVIGIVLLIGIVKKNAIMMIDFALEVQRDHGLSPRQAIQLAATTRFRPILMTTLAALLGALPLMLGTGVGSELRRPLGVTMVGGLIVSQLLTLYSTPAIYLAFDRLSRRMGQLRAQRREPQAWAETAFADSTHGQPTRAEPQP